MAWHRKVPFGYMVRGGELQPHPQEADTVRYIFRQYLAGASFLAIAEAMAHQGVRYHQHTAQWNKNMVKRILENAKYTGADGWPRLVSDENFTAAQCQRTQRNTYAPLSAKIQAIQDKIVCSQCGGRMARGTRSRGKVHWKCQNPDCGWSASLSDGALVQLVDARLRELAQAPHLLTVSEPQRTAPTMDAIRLQNELTVALNRGSENPAYIKKLALALAAQRYRGLPDPTPAHEMEQLRARLEQGLADADALADLLNTAVRAVRLTSDRCVELELVNGTIVNGRKEAEGA